jgi:methionyl aminopeptidase
MPVRTSLRPGKQTPMRPVPVEIPQPEYVGKPAPTPNHDPWTQPPEVIEAMRVAGRIAAQALAEGGRTVTPGVTTDEIDRVVHEFLLDHGAYPSTLGYHLVERGDLPRHPGLHGDRGR